MICEQTDFIYPMLADVYYPGIEQGEFGAISKTWIQDRTIAGNFSAAGAKVKEEVLPNVNITQDKVIIGRIRSDIRFSSMEDGKALTNVVITNIRDKNGNPIYLETVGQRAGKSTIFEIATQDPQIGAFGKVEYFKLVLRRSDNQAADI
jgi:hypothetical protein